MSELHFSTETQFQAHCFMWFWNNFPSERRMLFHADNNSYNAIVGNSKRSLGVVKGVSDLTLICRNGKVVFIEMKLPSGKQSQEQMDFEVKVKARGHEYILCYTFEQFRSIIIKNICHEESLGDGISESE